MLEVLEFIECVCSAESVSVDVYVSRCVSVKLRVHSSVMLLSTLKEARGSKGQVSSLVARQMSEKVRPRQSAFGVMEKKEHRDECVDGHRDETRKLNDDEPREARTVPHLACFSFFEKHLSTKNNLLAPSQQGVACGIQQFGRPTRISSFLTPLELRV